MKLTLATLLPALALIVGCSDKGTDTATSEDTETTETLPTDGVDADGDGFTTADDCDDSNVYINPDADEICDGIDNDCDGEIDNDALGAATWYADADGDNYGLTTSTLVACDRPDGYTNADGDCDDSDAAFNPGAEEFCDDPNDYNCDGKVEYLDDDGDGYAACEECDDNNTDINPDAEEVCDGVDNNCDGVTDSDATDATIWYEDGDSDGFGNDDAPISSCESIDGMITVGGDCDDSDRSINPDADEYCNELDDDCDSAIDEDPVDPATFFLDDDGDSFGDPTTGVESCESLPGYVSDASDCDDTNSSINPDAVERCDEVDEDCDTVIDEEAFDGSTWYADADGDSFGDPDAALLTCEEPLGYVSDASDCDDDPVTGVDINPDAEEICNDLDDDCDSFADEGITDTVTYYLDADGDGYGVDGDTIEDCGAPEGYSADNTDCDDSDISIYPGADEFCDELDQDCDTTIDEDAVDGTAWYLDSDEDTYGDDASLMLLCDDPEGYIERGGDCDDTDPAYNPGALEEDCADPNDYNCDGSVGSIDSDGDGYDACEECDDSQPYVYPGAPELCDGQPNDCDTVDSWVSDDTVVTLFPSDGSTPVDYSASFNAGTGAEVSISTSGELEVCDGAYIVRPRITASTLKITGSSPTDVIIDGGKVDQGPILLSANNINVSLTGVTITGGDGCFGGINAMYTSSCGAGSIGWSSYTGVVLTTTDVIVTDNDSPYGYYYYGGGISTRLAEVNMVNTAIFDNNMNGVFSHASYVTCEGDSDTDAGTWDNTFFGMQAYDWAYGPTTFEGSECDFDRGAPNGSGALNLYYATGCTTYADDETYFCDETGCDYCPP